jgi:methyl-accepting chemotaxis protein
MPIHDRQTQGLSAGFPFQSTANRVFCAGYIALSFIGTLTIILLYGVPWYWLVLPVIVSAIAIAQLQFVNRSQRAVFSIYQTLKNANKGAFHLRITDTRRLGEIGKVAWELNDMLDKVESYFKEVDACFRAVSHNHFERYALSSGMPGLLQASLDNINISIESMRRNDELMSANELHSQLHALNISNLIDNLVAVQNDLSKIGERMGTVEEIARDTGDSSRESRSAVSQMIHAMQEITEAIISVTEVVKQLDEDSTRVRDSLSIITDIA